MINPYEISKNIYLRKPIKEDLENSWYQWLSDPEITRYLGDRWWPNSQLEQKEFYENLIIKDKDNLVLSICLIENDKHIGIASLSKISWKHRYADIALIIGDNNYQNGVIATQVMSLLIKIAFERLNLENLLSYHISSNSVISKLEKIFGFRQVGKFHKIIFDDSKFVDKIFSQLSREDWIKNNS